MDKDMRGRVLEQLKRAKLISRKEKMDLLYDLKEVKAIEKEVAGKHVAELKRILSSVNIRKVGMEYPNVPANVLSEQILRLAEIFEDVPVAMARQRCPEVKAVLYIVERARAMVDTTPATPAEVVKKPKKAGGASKMVQFDANKVPAKMGFAHLSDNIVNAYSTCLMCNHPSIVCDRSIEDVEKRTVLESKWSSLPI
jgi:hypothetical protein